MVHGSELPFRLLLRENGVNLCFSPMIDCQPFLQASEKSRCMYFETSLNDRPLVAQFCTDNAKLFIEAARIVAPTVDAVDLNLGCPKKRAWREHFGVALMNEWRRVKEVLSAAVRALEVPVSCKIRIYPDDIEKSVAYARELASTGISFLTVHGRGPKDGRLARVELATIAAIKDALEIPVIANGGVRSMDDVEKVLQSTGCDAVMIASAFLVNPFLAQTSSDWSGCTNAQLKDAVAFDAARAYLAKCRECGFDITNRMEEEVIGFRIACIRDHLRSFFRPVLTSPENDATVMRMMKGLLLNRKLRSIRQFEAFVDLLHIVVAKGMNEDRRTMMKRIRDAPIDSMVQTEDRSNNTTLVDS